MMNIVNNHAHARYGYGALAAKDFYRLLVDAVEAKVRGYLSFNVHLPFEIQHPKFYPHINKGKLYLWLGEALKRILKINLYWENAPAQNNHVWTLKYGQTNWTNVPNNIELTLDTGHLILGAKNNSEAKLRIEKFLHERGKQIKHLHLHENNLVNDTHDPVGKVIDKTLLEKIIKNRTYIFEKAVLQAN